MLVKSVTVENLLCIRNESMSLDRLTVLVGPNGAGKSAFLRALSLFFDPSPKVTADDFYAKRTADPIRITVTFADLGPNARDLFAKYTQGDTLTVLKEISLAGSKTEHSWRGLELANPDFSTFWSASKAAEAKSAYNHLRTADLYGDLPPWSNHTEAQAALRRWQDDHPDACQRLPDDGKFFGFKNVAQGYLGRFIIPIYVPAVRDAADAASDGRGSDISLLLDILIRNSLLESGDYAALKNELVGRFRALLAGKEGREPHLSDVQRNLTTSLRQYVPDAAVRLSWDEATDIDIPLPRVDVRLVEDGYPALVSNAGQGLQRALVMSLLQQLAVARRPPSATSPSEEDSRIPDEAPSAEPPPTVLLLIEEPEIYQHPSRQRKLARTLRELAESPPPERASRVQVAYCTHAPQFVGLDRFDRVRLLRKVVSSGHDEPRATTVQSSTMNAVAAELWEAWGKKGKPYTANTLAARIEAIMTPWMNEGFFANLVVLVEGESDRAAILTAAELRGIDPEGEGVAVIPCGGKTNIDRPAVIFTRLDIPVYLVWDGDKGKPPADAKPETNRVLSKMCEVPPADYPDFIGKFGTCFAADLESMMRNEVGEALYNQCLAKVAAELEAGEPKKAAKRPKVMERLLRELASQGAVSTSLDQMVDNIMERLGSTSHLATYKAVAGNDRSPSG